MSMFGALSLRTSVIPALALLAVAAAVLALGNGREARGQATSPLAYISNTGSDEVWVVDIDAQAVVDVVDVGDDPRGIDITPDNSRVYVANRFDNTISVIDTSTNTALAPIDLGASPTVTATEPYDVVVSADGSYLYVAMKNGGSENGDGTVVVVDLPAGTVLAEEVLDSAASPEGIAVTPDGQKVYVAARGPMYVVDVSNPASPNFTGTTGLAERELVVSPDGAWVYSDGNVIRTSDDLAFALSDVIGVRGVAISPDGLTLYCTDDDSSVGVLGVTAGNPPDATYNQVITDGSLFEAYGIDLTDEGDRGVVSFRGSDAVRIFDTATNTFIGSAIDMLFPAEQRDGDEPKQLVISHTIQPTATPSPTPVDVGAGGQAPSPTPAQLPETGGSGADGGSAWLVAMIAGAIAAAAGAGSFALLRRR